jgi:translation initiation factor SUI1
MDSVYNYTIRMDILNITNRSSFDDFGIEDDDDLFEESKQSVIISIQQRTARKSTTKIEGLSTKVDLKKIVKELQHLVQSSGSISDVEGHGKVIVFQGDKRNVIIKYLIDNKYVQRENIKVMGY